MTKQPTLTKDQLLAENGMLQNRITILKEQDEKLRAELSTALNAPRETGSYGHVGDQITYSWYEIFRELGKLISRKNHADFIDDLDSLSKKLHRLHDKVEQHLMDKNADKQFPGREC